MRPLSIREAPPARGCGGSSSGSAVVKNIRNGSDIFT